jgi:two-component system LytT family response regulator
MKTMRVMIVDDEPHARQRLRTLLEGEPALEVVGEAGDGLEALEKIRALTPDVVFLDIQMPELSGLQLLERLSGERVPRVVFTTAYDEYAIEAFDLAALDYLLKPFDRERFQKALGRARAAFEGGGPGFDPRELKELIDQVRGGGGGRGDWREKRLVVKVGSKVRFLNVDEIECVLAEGDYVAVQVGKETLLVRERMRDVEGRLERHGFFRIHRSSLINLAWLREMRPFRHGDYEFVMASGKVLQSSPTYRDQVQQLAANR